VTQIVSIKQVAQITSLSRATLDRMRRDGRFPKPVRLTARRIGFRLADVEAWMADLGNRTGE